MIVSEFVSEAMGGVPVRPESLVIWIAPRGLTEMLPINPSELVD